jgi:hypothetical protein
MQAVGLVNDHAPDCFRRRGSFDGITKLTRGLMAIYRALGVQRIDVSTAEISAHSGRRWQSVRLHPNTCFYEKNNSLRWFDGLGHDSRLG